MPGCRDGDALRDKHECEETSVRREAEGIRLNTFVLATLVNSFATITLWQGLPLQAKSFQLLLSSNPDRNEIACLFC